MRKLSWDEKLDEETVLVARSMAFGGEETPKGDEGRAYVQMLFERPLALFIHKITLWREFKALSVVSHLDCRRIQLLFRLKGYRYIQLSREEEVLS